MRCQVLTLESVLYSLLFVFIIFASYNIFLYLSHSFSNVIEKQDALKYMYTLEKVQSVLLENSTYSLVRLKYPTMSKLPYPCSKVVLNNGTVLIYTR